MSFPTLRQPTGPARSKRLSALTHGGFATTLHAQSSLAIQTDGKAVEAGSVVVRFNPNGNLDTTSENGGTASIPGGHGYASVAIQTDGRVAHRPCGHDRSSRFDAAGQLPQGKGNRRDARNHKGPRTAYFLLLPPSTLRPGDALKSIWFFGR